MEATLRRRTVPLIVWALLIAVVIFLATYPIFWDPIQDTPATEDQSFPNAPTPPNERGFPEEPVPRPDPNL